MYISNQDTPAIAPDQGDGLKTAVSPQALHYGYPALLNSKDGQHSKDKFPHGDLQYKV